MRATLHTPPTAEPINLNEAKLHLRLAADVASAAAYTAEDASLSAFVAASRQVAEAETWRAVVLQTWDLYLDEWPVSDEVVIPFPPLRRVDGITYTDSAGVEYTLAATEYDVDTASEPGRVVLGYGKTWPSVTLSPKNPIRIRFAAGHLIPFTASTTADTLTAHGHPFADGDTVRLSVSGGSLPSGLSEMTTYYVRDAAVDSLKLAASSGGVAIDITTAGSGSMFMGTAPSSIITGMKLVLTDLYENRSDTVMERLVTPTKLHRAASHWFAMESAKGF